ncbi:MAG TPA: S-methyl-5-thioribose-1-phosphate isomerase [Clostridia bacterium]|nr:S-methyl-5-thioribose-1-phosphate isomerase [Clostridia bacterium]
MLSPLRFTGDAVYMVDQRLLPFEFEEVRCETAEDVAKAIRTMTVRGAPAIGIAAAYGMALAARRAAEENTEENRGAADADLRGFLKEMTRAAEVLKAARPTAVNLAWAVDRMLGKAHQTVAEVKARAVAGAKTQTVTQSTLKHIAEDLAVEALKIHQEDVAVNKLIGSHGAHLIGEGYGVLTHCNAGALATGGYGTALGVIRAAWEKGKRFKVFVDETRPFLQGARLTAWELLQDGIDAVLITYNMAAYFMWKGDLNIVIVGADRVAANGDVANKIGTYGLAVLAREHGIPFYVAAPISTLDISTPNGSAIPIEERDRAEVVVINGKEVAPAGVAVRNPAFDVTPARYVTGIITEKGIIYPPYEINLDRVMRGA